MYVGSSIYNSYSSNYGSSSMNVQSRYQQQEQAFMEAMSQSQGGQQGMRETQGMGQMQGMQNMQGMSQMQGMGQMQGMNQTQGMQGMPPPPPGGGMGGMEETSGNGDGVGTLMDYVSSLSSDEQSSTLQDLSSLSKEGMDALVDALGGIDSTEMTDEELSTEIASIFEDILSQFSSSDDTTSESVVIDTYA